MSELRDFEVGKSHINLDDFSFDVDEVKVNSEASNRNTAAHVAILSGATAEETYRNTLGELNNGNLAVTGSEGPVGHLINREFNLARESLVDIISDPTISDEVKLTVSENFSDKFMEMTTPRNLVSSITASEANPDDSVETETVALDIGPRLLAVNKYKSDVQAIVNASASHKNESVMTSVGNFADLVLPFVESTMTSNILNDLKSGDSSKLFSTLFMGEARNDIVQAAKKLPLDKRLEFFQNLADIVNNNIDMVFTDDNQLAAAAFLADVLETEDVYDGFDRTIDNTISLLDASIIGIPVAKGISKVLQLGKVSQAIKEGVRSAVKPAALTRNVKDTNARSSRKLDESISNDATGEVAEAAAGTTRTEAIADVRLPEIGNEAGRITDKVSMHVNDEVKTFVDDNGAIYFGEAEKVPLRQKAIEMVTRDEMFTVNTIDELPDGVRIRGVYGMRDSGFLDPQDALDVVEFNLRHTGIKREDLILLKKGDDGQRMEIPNVVTGEGDYLVGVDWRYKFNPADNTQFFSADVKRNFFDRMNLGSTGKHGTLMRFLLDPASMLHPVLAEGAQVAVDRTFGLEKILSDQGKVFSKKFSKLSTNRRGILEDEIKYANKEGVDFNYTRLKAGGFSNDEVQILKDWREIWDTVYWLENRDLAKNLRNQGFMTLSDKASDTVIFARPMKQRHAVKDNVLVYDYANETLRKVGNKELDELYEGGGFISKMKSTKQIGEESAEFVISQEKKGGSFLKAISDSDQVLNYRKGYYQVQYKAPKFVEKIVTNNQGKVLYRGAVATADTIRDANITAARMTKSISADEVNGVKYVVRGDVKGNAMDDSYDLAFSRGRTAQRTRGERLEDGSGSGIQAADDNHILDPVEALTKSIRSVSRRTQMREYLDATKDRFMRQYGDLLKTDKHGQKLFPSSRAEIGTAEHATSKLAADARTTWEYLNYLEHGYVNAISDFYKGALNMFADGIGEYAAKKGSKSLTTVEKGLRSLAAKRSPDDLARSAAFKLYLAMNPLRQLMVQSHQAIRLNYIAPQYMATRAAPETAVLVNGIMEGKSLKPLLKMAGHTESSAAQLVKDYKRSGFLSAVDANNLVRGDLQKLADLTYFEKGISALNSPIKLSQKLGFDAGEELNIMLTWLAFRDKALKAGKTLDSAELDKIGAQARNWSYNMNAAGDLAYNRNFMSMIMQFAQIPHKAFLANLTNRQISPAVKARAAALDTLMFGVPSVGGIGLYISQHIPDDQPELKQGFVRGFEELAINNLLTAIFKEDIAVDFSSLAPTDISGYMSMVYELWTTDIGDLVASSPSGQLFFGGNPRVTNLIKDSMSLMGLGPEEEMSQKDLEDVFYSMAKISSGTSNMLKSIMAFESGQVLNSRGQVTNGTVNNVEAVFQAFGLGTIEAATNFKVSRELYEKSKAYEDDFNIIIKDYMRSLSNQGLSAEEVMVTGKAYGATLKAWRGQSRKGQELIRKFMSRALKDPSHTLYQTMKKVINNGSIPPEELDELIRGSGLDKDAKELLTGALKDAREYRNEE